MTDPTTKVRVLLSQMAERQGEKISARDVAALLLAVRTLEALQVQLAKSQGAWGDQAMQSIKASAEAASMRDGIRALLEVHS